jgi:hypothetical protein
MVDTVETAIYKLAGDSSSYVKAATDAAAAGQKLAASNDNISVSSDKVTKATRSTEDGFARLQGRFDPAIRAQQQYQKVLDQVARYQEAGIGTTQQHAQVIASAAKQYDQISASSKGFQQALASVNGQIVALSAGAGPVGTFLAALGPWGVAAAVGIVLVEKAFMAADGAAHALAQRAIELRQFSDVTGLSTNSVQALRSEAGKFGLTADEAQTSIQNFTARFNELRLGSGDLLTQIRRINPALADQMAATNDAGQALTLFGQALTKVDDVFQRNALIKAATGKGGLSSSAFLTGLDVSKVTQGFVDAGKALDENMINKLRQLEIDINRTSAAITKNFASIFAPELLGAELTFYQSLLAISTWMRDFKASPAWDAFAFGLKSLGAVPLFGPAFMALGALAGKSRSPDAANDNSASFDSRFGGFSGGASSTTLPQFQAASLKAQISAMGDAATYSQRLQLAQKELAIAGKDAGLSQDQLSKALKVLNETSASQQLQARIGALGDLATVSEQVRAAQMRLDLERAKGVQLSDQETAAILRRTQVQAESAKLQQQNQFGIFDPTRQAANARAELQTLIDNGTVKNANDYAAAQTVIAKRLRDTADAAAVARSNLPQLQQFINDSGNLNKQLDTVATGSLNNLTGALTDITNGTVSASDGFKNLALQVIRSIEQMVIQMTIALPIAQALRSTLGGGSILGGGTLTGADAALNNAIFPGFGTGHTGAIIGSSSSGTSYIHPAYFDNAPRMHAGGMLGQDEVPFIGKRGEEVGWPSQLAAKYGGGTLKQEITFKIDGAVGKEEISGMIRDGMSQARQQAVSIASAAAPARQDRYNKLGT